VPYIYTDIYIERECVYIYMLLHIYIEDILIDRFSQVEDPLNGRAAAS